MHATFVLPLCTILLYSNIFVYLLYLEFFAANPTLFNKKAIYLGYTEGSGHMRLVYRQATRALSKKLKAMHCSSYNNVSQHHDLATNNIELIFLIGNQIYLLGWLTALLE